MEMVPMEGDGPTAAADSDLPQRIFTPCSVALSLGRERVGSHEHARLQGSRSQLTIVWQGWFGAGPSADARHMPQTWGFGCWTVLVLYE